MRPTQSGGLVGGLAPGGNADAAYAFMPVLRNFADPRALDTDTTSAILGNPALRADHAARIAELASFNRFDGIFIDYRGLNGEQRADFSLFIADVAERFSGFDLRLGVTIPAALDAGGEWDSAGYDWRAIGAAADYFHLRPLLDPRHFAPAGPGTLADLLGRAASLVDRDKILVGLSVRAIRDVRLAATIRSIGIKPSRRSAMSW